MSAKGVGPVKLASVLGEILEEQGLTGQVKRMAALDLWGEVVGEHIAAATTARSVEGGKLFVEVRSSGWLMELNMMKGELLARLNERMPEAPLERIVFVLAENG